MALYQKHRPTKLSEVKGNKNVTAPLRTMLKNPETTPHSYLFHGPTGCGKTTLARIMAQELGCTENNIIEIDAAQFRGIDTIRELRKNAQYIPLGGGKRTYILDEVHKITGDAANALLKILEDTPSHAYFILCTTEPQTLLPTIRGRCSQFQVQTLNDDEMTELLSDILEKEQVEVETDVIEQIVLDSQGHPRNAIVILEQVINTPRRRRLEVAKQSAVEQTQAIELCRALIGNKAWSTISTILNGLKGQEAESVRRVVLGYVTAVLLKSDNAKAAHILECFEEPLYNIGFPGLVLACYRVINS